MRQKFMLSVNGFTINDTLYISPITQVYRATRDRDKRSVILRTCEEQTNTSHIARLSSTADLLKTFEHPHIIKLLDVINQDGQTVLVLEDTASIDLNDYLQGFEQNSLPLDIFFDIAIQLTNALSTIHHAQIIHKDLHPGNIIVNPESRKLQIIDFGLACLLSREQPTIEPPEKIEGMLAYLSPEQTGRMNRALDYRTDFYTLGVTLYQCLTGILPFNAPDALGMVYAHMATQQIPACEIRSETPIILSRIIDKLMNKNAEDRYQSALGLRYDLETCRYEWHKSSTIDTFKLGARDVSERFQIRQNLYGRSEEINTLITHFHYVVAGQPQLLAISGYSGIGKSALVHEVHKPIAAHNGLFISGKFDQFKQSTPYSALKHAFKGWLHHVLSQPEASLKQQRQQLLDILGTNARALIDFLSEFETLLGHLEAVPTLGSQETQARFHWVFKTFINTITQSHPLVLFIDDLQWADQGTMNLIPELVKQSTNSKKTKTRLFVMVTYRDNDVDEHHPVKQMLDKIRQCDHDNILSEVHLTPLPEADIKQLLIDTLHCSDEAVIPLTRLVHQKTAGNPFFTREFLKTLYCRKLLNFDLATQQWQWNLDDIHAESITDNVVELMLQKMQSLPTDTQRLLQLAACIGTQFDLDTLAIISEQPMSDTCRTLWPALKVGLVIQEGGDWLLGMQLQATRPQANAKNNQKLGKQPKQIPRCRFIHDRMLQAAYESLDNITCKHTHLAIGRLLYQHMSETQRENQVFKLVNQLNYGDAFIHDANEKARLATLNYRAANKARQAGAWVDASNYAHLGLALLPEPPWKTSYPLCYLLTTLQAECENLSGHNVASEALYEQLLTHTNNDLDKAEQCALRIVQYIGQAEYEKALVIGIKGLSFLGLTFPQDGTALKNYLAKQKIRLDQAFLKTPLEKICQLPETNDRNTQLSLYILTNLGLSSLLLMRPTFFSVCIQKCLLLSITKGKCDLTAIALAIYGMTLNIQENYDRAYLAGQLALKIKNQYPNCRESASLLNIIAFGSAHLKSPPKKTLVLYQQGYEEGLHSGELARAGVNLAGELNVLLNNSPITQYLSHAQRCLEFAKAKGLFLPYARIHYQCAQSLQQHEDLLGSENFTQKEAQAIENSIFKVWLQHCQFHYLFWSDQQPVITLEHTKQLVSNYQQLKQSSLTAEFYFMLCLSVLRALKSGDLQPGTKKTKAWRAHHQIFLQKLQDLNACYPPNHQHKISLLEAQQLSLDKAPMETVARCYQHAIAAATTNGINQYTALGNELYGDYLNGMGFHDFAMVHITKAFSLYKNLGYQPKLDNLPLRYSFLSPVIASNASPVMLNSGMNNDIDNSPHSSSSSPLEKNLDIDSIMKSSQAISSQLALNELVSEAMSIIMENAGAQVGALVLSSHDVDTTKATLEAFVDKPNKRSDYLQHKTLTATIDLPISLIGLSLRTGELVNLKNACQEGHYTNESYIAKRQIKSALCVPIHYRDKLLGTLYLENNLITGAFSKERIDVIHMLLTQASISFENARLFTEITKLNTGLEAKVASKTKKLLNALRDQEQLNDQLLIKTGRLNKANEKLTLLATIDSLTGAFNRRHFLEQANIEIARSRRYRNPVSVLMLDIDFFKKVNDLYGHAAGDEALREVSTACKNSLREQDIFGRLGGEEFAILLLETNQSGGLEIAERIRQTIEGLTINAASVDFNVTMSIGLAQFSPHIKPKQTAVDLLQIADLALYQSKENGRNQVTTG